MDVFFNSEYRLRAGWRLAFFVVALVPARIAASGIAGILDLGETAAGLLGLATLQLLAVAVPTAMAARITEQRGFLDVGFAPRSGWGRELAFGVAFGTALLGVTVLPAALAGRLDLGPGTPGPSLAVVALFFLVAASYEELLCRGFPLQVLASGIGSIPAALLMSATFALFHGANPGVTWTALATTFVAGVLLSIAYFRTRSLWLATGIHLGWNFSMGYVLGLPVSGLRYFPDAPVLVGGLGDPVWLTGGAYGPEGGASALAVLALGCAVLVFLPLPRVAPAVSPEA